MVLEHVVEGAAQQTAEQVAQLRQAANPQVNVVKPGAGHVAGIRPGGDAEHEVAKVIGREDVVGALIILGRSWIVKQDAVRSGQGRAIDDLIGRNTLAGQRRLRRDGRVLAVGRDEVDQRLGVLERQTEIHPVYVWPHLTIIRRRENLSAHIVQRRDAFTARAGYVDAGQVKRQAQQVVA